MGFVCGRTLALRSLRTSHVLVSTSVLPVGFLCPNSFGRKIDAVVPRREGGSHTTPERGKLPADYVRFLASRHPCGVAARLSPSKGRPMRKTRRPAPARTHAYVISDNARDTVVRARDHLLLLARLCAARIDHDADKLELSSRALVTVYSSACATTWTTRCAT